MSSKGSDHVKTKYTFEGKQLLFMVLSKWLNAGNIQFLTFSAALLYKPLDRVMKTTLVLHVRHCSGSHLSFIYKYTVMPMDLLTFFSILLRTCGSTRPPIIPTASRYRKRFVSPAASCLGSMKGRSANVLSCLAEERYSLTLHCTRHVFMLI